MRARARAANYSTILPSTRLGRRRALGYAASAVFHVLLLVLILIRTSRRT
jgi:hypothetical protein